MKTENIKELLRLSLIERERTIGKPVSGQDRKEIEDAIRLLVQYGGEAAIKAALVEMRKNNYS